MEATEDSTAGLCERCVDIPVDRASLDRILNDIPRFLMTTKVLCYIQGFSDGDCKLCSLLRETANEYGMTGQEFQILLNKSKKSWDEPCVTLELREVNNTISRSGWIAFKQQFATHERCGLWAIRIKPGSINWKTLKRWIHYCDEKHDLCYKPPELTVASLPGFLVIDCNTRNIVRASKNCRYTALSYVWGSTAEPPSDFSATLPSPAPPTIEDALVCTQAIGLRFLWVDRYCIDQQASDTKHTLIQNMDQIYRSAMVTIVDGTGESPVNGLPGVSHTPRRPQKMIPICGHSLAMVPNIKSEVERSKWSSRGWTYQEGLLAHRRLVFTRSQVYFQCLEMYCCESISGQFSSQGIWQRHKLESNLQIFPPRGMRTQYLHARDTAELRDRLKEYLGRDLTYEADILNAFMGVFRQFWRLDTPVYHIWGLPFRLGRQESRLPHFRLLCALLWIPECDANETHITRREMFPSWTWAAWRGITGICGGDSSWPDRAVNVSVNLENLVGESLSIHDYVLSMDKNWDTCRFKPLIKLTGWTTTVRIRQAQPLSFNATYSRTSATILVDLYDDPSGALITRATIIGTCLLDQGMRDIDYLYFNTWSVFLFVQSNGLFTGLVLKPVGGDTYERGGVLGQAFCTMTKLNEDTARFRERGWDSSIWLGCEKRTIWLV